MPISGAPFDPAFAVLPIEQIRPANRILTTANANYLADDVLQLGLFPGLWRVRAFIGWAAVAGVGFKARLALSPQGSSGFRFFYRLRGLHNASPVGLFDSASFPHVFLSGNTGGTQGMARIEALINVTATATLSVDVSREVVNGSNCLITSGSSLEALNLEPE